MFAIAIILISMIGTAISLCYGVFFLAKLRFGLALRREGEIMILMKGREYVRSFGKIKDYAIQRDGRIIKREQEEDIFENPLYWLGIEGPFLPLIYEVHLYWFDWDSWMYEEDPTTGIADAESPDIKHRREKVTSLYFRYTYPVVAESVELGDNFKIRIRGNITVQATNAYKAVILLKGRWFKPLTDRIRGEISQAVKQMTFDTFRGGEKQKMFSAAITHEDVKKALADETGMMPISYEFLDFDLVEDASGNEAAALVSGQQEALLAAAAIKKAEGQKRVRELAGEGEAAYIRLTGDAEAGAFKKIAETPEGAAMHIAAQIANSKITTLAQGGNSILSLPTSRPENKGDEDKPDSSPPEDKDRKKRPGK